MRRIAHQFIGEAQKPRREVGSQAINFLIDILLRNDSRSLCTKGGSGAGQAFYFTTVLIISIAAMVAYYSYNLSK